MKYFYPFKLVHNIKEFVYCCLSIKYNTIHFTYKINFFITTNFDKSLNKILCNS